MHRFYIAPESWDPRDPILRDAEAHHARDVLRLKRGERAVLFNGRGREITAEIVDLAKGEVRLRKLHEGETPPLRCRITLGQAIPKGKNMELIVQKAVEIGAAEIAPLISERTKAGIDAGADEQQSSRSGDGTAPGFRSACLWHTESIQFIERPQRSPPGYVARVHIHRNDLRPGGRLARPLLGPIPESAGAYT